MSNKAVSFAFFTTYAGQRDVEGCSPLFADKAVISTSVAPSPMDFAAYKQVGYAFLGGFADLKAEVHEQIEAGNKVVSRVVWSGTHTGALNGIPATGRTFSSEAIFIDTSRTARSWNAAKSATCSACCSSSASSPRPRRA